MNNIHTVLLATHRRHISYGSAKFIGGRLESQLKQLLSPFLTERKHRIL